MGLLIIGSLLKQEQQNEHDEPAQTLNPASAKWLPDAGIPSM